MSASEARMNGRTAELRDAFDQSFAQPPRTEAGTVEKLLTISIGVDQYAVRLAEVSGLFADKRVTWLPSPVSELRGVAGFRGTLLPVYDLGMLLGCPKVATPRWLVVTATTPVALAFEGFGGYLNVRGEAIVPEAAAAAREQHVREVVQAADLVRPLISLASVLEWIQHRSSRAGLEKER